MNKFQISDLKRLYLPPPNSHKGQNGKLMIIGGSQLFHAASLWSLKVASRIVDMVYYSSTLQNNEIISQAKREFRDGIVVPRNRLEDYVDEADCVLIGPGLPRKEGQEEGDDDTKKLTEGLLKKYPNKKWVIDGGSLQMMGVELLKTLKGNVIITPHKGEFEKLFTHVIPNSFRDLNSGTNEMLKPASQRLASTLARGEQVQHDIKKVEEKAKEYNIIILLKGQVDIVCSPEKCVRVEGGNAGMTKGGTGDVLAGLTAALYCKNDAFLAASCASYINKKAGESLYQRVGLYFNASDLADEIPRVMKEIL